MTTGERVTVSYRFREDGQGEWVVIYDPPRGKLREIGVFATDDGKAAHDFAAGFVAGVDAMLAKMN